MSKVALLVVLATCVLCAQAWGPIGHETAATIGMKYLSSAAFQDLQQILANDGGGNLVIIANWADQVRDDPNYKWSAPLHYVDTPDWECSFTYATDCVNDFCVAGAIANYSQRIQQTDPSVTDEAAKFLTHFMGDAHQPLHVAFASDRGGNSIHGSFYGQSVNLHALWDGSIIDQRMKQQFNGAQQDYVNYLISTIDPTNATAWASCLTQGGKPNVANCINQWAADTASLACQYAYSDVDGSHIQNGFDLSDAYYQRAAPIVDMQLQKAGVRMAALFNALLH